MSTAIAKNLMAEMKLFGMLATFDKVLSDATRDQSSYSELLDALLQAEADYRQERKTGYRIKAAKFTLRPGFEDIDFAASRSITKTQIKELSNGEVEGPRAGARLEPRAHNLFQRPRRHYRVSRHPPTIVRRTRRTHFEAPASQRRFYGSSTRELAPCCQ